MDQTEGSISNTGYERLKQCRAPDFYKWWPRDRIKPADPWTPEFNPWTSDFFPCKNSANDGAACRILTAGYLSLTSVFLLYTIQSSEGGVTYSSYGLIDLNIENRGPP